MPEMLGRSLSENLITLLAHSDEYGGLVASFVQPELFEGDFRIIATRTMDYWRQHRQAPKLHTIDLFADILERGGARAGAIRTMLQSMVLLSEGVNAAYVLGQLRTFSRIQAIKVAIVEAAQTFQNDPQGSKLEQVEKILGDIARARVVAFEPGTKLSDYRALIQHIGTMETEFDLGIPLLDNLHIAPMRGTLLNLLGVTGGGKSWFCIQAGKRAVLHRKKVVHITNELSEVQTLQRYYQAIFAMPLRATDSVSVPRLLYQLDAAAEEPDRWNVTMRHNLREVVSETHEITAHMESPDLVNILQSRVERFGLRFGNMVIKNFPERSLTMDMLRGYLDSLETVENFIPDMIICDYPGKMKIDPRHYRIELGMIYSEFRGLLQERNAAGVSVHQASKKGAEARIVTARHASEDWSIVQTSDVVLTLSSTDLERRFKLARIFVEKARTERDKFGILITQNYDIGQFALQCAPLREAYYDYRDGVLGGGNTNDSDDDSEDGD